MEIWCVKGMYRLKLISSGNNSVFKGLTQHRRIDENRRKINSTQHGIDDQIHSCTKEFIQWVNDVLA